LKHQKSGSTHRGIGGESPGHHSATERLGHLDPARPKLFSKKPGRQTPALSCLQTSMGLGGGLKACRFFSCPTAVLAALRKALGPGRWCSAYGWRGSRSDPGGGEWAINRKRDAGGVCKRRKTLRVWPGVAWGRIGSEPYPGPAKTLRRLGSPAVAWGGPRCLGQCTRWATAPYRPDPVGWPQSTQRGQGWALCPAQCPNYGRL